MILFMITGVMPITDLGNLRQAIEDYDRAIEINPENAGAYYNRGVAYGKLGDHRQAIEDYDRAIEINPEYAEAYNNRGARLWQTRQPQAGDFGL